MGGGASHLNRSRGSSRKSPMDGRDRVESCDTVMQFNKMESERKATDMTQKPPSGEASNRDSGFFDSSSERNPVANITSAVAVDMPHSPSKNPHLSVDTSKKPLQHPHTATTPTSDTDDTTPSSAMYPNMCVGEAREPQGDTTPGGEHKVKRAPGISIVTQTSKMFTYEEYDAFLPPHGVLDPICILHFNDVYNIEVQKDQAGGASRFISALRSFQHLNPLILFSGDAFNPSMMSTNSKGKHMVPFMNMLRIHTACYGNHDFDFGVDELEYLAGSTNFPWLISNVKDRHTMHQLANGQVYRLCEWQGHKIGFMGLVEREWLATLATITEKDVIYEDFVETANRVSRTLRMKGAEFIIALTHMRSPNDERLAREAEDVDLILGGHDHDYYGCMQIGKSVVCKSGTDFREFTKIDIYPGQHRGVDTRIPPLPPVGTYVSGNRKGGACFLPKFRGGSMLKWSCVDVNPQTFHSIPAVDNIVQEHLKEMAAAMNKIVGETAVELETRFKIIRTQESNCGNWLCDLMRHATRANCAVLNSGTIRSDTVFPVGYMRLKDLISMLPMMDPLCVMKCSGRQLLKVLENGVSQWPKLEGRFPQVSGLRFKFDGSKPAGQRVLADSVMVLELSGSASRQQSAQNSRPSSAQSNSSREVWLPLNLDRPDYLVCTKEYLGQGKDGYDVFCECETVLDGEIAGHLQTMVRNSLSMAAMASGFKQPRSLLTAAHLQEFLQQTPDSMRHCYGVDRVVSEPTQKPVYKIIAEVEGRIVRVGA